MVYGTGRGTHIYGTRHFGNGKPSAPRTAFSFFESLSVKNVTFFLSDIF